MLDFRPFVGKKVILTLVSGARYCGTLWVKSRRGQSVCLLTGLIILAKAGHVVVAPKGRKSGGVSRSWPVVKVAAVALDPFSQARP